MSASPAQNSATAPTTKLLAPGDMVDGRYRIEAYLGGGGMASVYRATHVVLEQPVAIKVICPVIREVPGMAQRFLREARAATQLKSEHVARVTDVGTMTDGAPFMVMEYLDGRDLNVLVESGEELSIEEAVDYILQSCEALAEVHGLGIVHRDLKPANLFLTKGADGLPCVKLIDFGISRTDSPLSPKDVIGLTQPDTVMGSPRYMSPEQMESATKADCRSDIYGIGAVLYELLTKRGPHEGDTFLDLYAAATLGPPVAPSSLRSDIPHALDEVILRCLRIEPGDRYADAAELALALAPFGPSGSLARAHGIERILESARARTRDGSTGDDGFFQREGSGSSSKVRRRGASAYTVRRRRIVRGAIIGVTLAIAGLVYGGRTLYSRGEASGIASSAATSPPPLLAIAPVVIPPSAPTPTVDITPTATPTTPTTPMVTVAPRSVAIEPIPVAPAPARIEEPMPPAPRAAPPWRPTPPPADTTADEKKLFEDRK
jgi:eukaryotic-like serine/threonine-protein kinase